ncbi:MAG: DUF3857 domain-containing protein [Prolixibacteraceae bacterium]|nr:DUF3857 domain-containing protein [Prolixibacteraceae bacterium]
MKKIVSILALSSILILSANVFGKNNKPRFGKINKEELKTNVCHIDSNAHAYYIFDIGESDFSYNNFDGFIIEYNRHFRIKIVDNEGLKEATISIPYYEYSKSKEKIYGIKAYSYNLEKGKVVKTKLKRKEIYDEQTSKYWRQVKFAIPNAKEGSVIEVKYNKKSNMLWSLPGWQFQHFIPALLSEYEVSIPEYFHYNQFFRGQYIPVTKKDIEINSIPQSNNKPISYQCTSFNYKIEDVPAFPVGEKLTTPQNYISKIEYEIASHHFPGSLFKSYTRTWQDIDELFLDDDDFGVKLKMDGFLNKTAETISSSEGNEKDKMIAAVNKMKSTIKWDGRLSCRASKTLRRTFETGSGNSADVNLNLVALLKKLNLKAYPVVLSTRKNGMIHPAYPSINQMNYVIALCDIAGEHFLLDATEKYSEINVLPERCLNGEGRIVDKEKKGWIPLLQGNVSKTTTRYIYSFVDDNTIEGDVTSTEHFYDAVEKRATVNDFESVDKYIEKLEEHIPGLKINDCQFTHLDTTDIELKCNMNVTIDKQVDVAGDLIFFKPLLFDCYEKNPFSLEKREYPIEYPYPFSEIVISKIEIPANYKLESSPESVKITAVNGKCQFMYNVSTLNNILSITSSISVNQTLIPSQYYNEIKSFFEKVVEKHLEQVVLKKI